MEEEQEQEINGLTLDFVNGFTLNFVFFIMSIIIFGINLFFVK
jgi:hypothetical protein